MVDPQRQRRADLQRPLLDLDLVDDQVAEPLLRVEHVEPQAGREHQPGVADLAARFAVERRLVEDEPAALAAPERTDLGAVAHDRARHALGGLGLVAEELGRAEPLAQSEPHRLGRRLARAGPGLARLGALALHRRGEAVVVDAHAARAQRVLGQVEREAVGVVELERDLAGELGAGLERARLLLEDRQAAHQRRAEARLLELQRLGDQRLGAGAARDRPAPISRVSAGTSRHISGSRAPSSWAWRMARRMMRRRT